MHLYIKTLQKENRRLQEIIEQKDEEILALKRDIKNLHGFSMEMVEDKRKIQSLMEVNKAELERRLNAELQNKKLRAVLKPILACPMSIDDDPIVCAQKCLQAMGKAYAIMKSLLGEDDFS